MKRVLFISSVFPEPSSSAAGWRTEQLIAYFYSENYQIHFASTSQENEFSLNLDLYQVKRKTIEVNNASFDEFLKEIIPEIVIYDRFFIEEQFSWRVKEVCPQTLQIIDTQDLHFLRKYRQSNKNELVSENIWKEEETLRELTSLFRSDLNLIISEFEYQFLQEFVPQLNNLHYFPLLSEIKQLNFKSFEKRKNFMFIGNFHHEPNADAVLEIKKNWNKIQKQLPDTQMHIYGAYPNKKIEDLNDPKLNFFIKGRCENAKNTIENYRLMLVPLRFGAGIKGKIIQAIETGTPFVSTKIGVEGIFENNYFFKNEEGDFIKQAISLYQNKEKWTNFQNQMIEKSMGKFDKIKHNLKFKDKLLLLKKLKLSKNYNIFANILEREQFRSTKFLSKWIEEKNKNH